MASIRGYIERPCPNCGDIVIESKRIDIGQPFTVCTGCFGSVPLEYKNEWDLMTPYDKAKFGLLLVWDWLIYTLGICLIVLLLICFCISAALVLALKHTRFP